jgi:alpha-beta hydrolase superfamily lysophospholipase
MLLKVAAVVGLCMAVTATLVTAPSTAAAVAVIPPGDGEVTAEIAGVPLRLFTYRPEGCAVTGILLVFHGVGRDATGYRDSAKPLAQRLCMLVVAPLFDEQRFPAWRYQRGGIVHDGKVQPPDSWTIHFVPRLVAWARAEEKRPDLPYALIGHSGGGQFLSRVVAFEPVEATRIVIANPSTWVLPTLDTPAPYGFGGVYDPPQAEAALRRYLAAPVTVLLGQEDTGSHELAVGPEADAQGATRLARGQNAFRQAEAVARAHGWTFNWRLAFVPGVGHSARLMFGSAQALEAFQP